jgi:mannose-6-phosphate isomerase-like protein (cupin superfamily)
MKLSSKQLYEAYEDVVTVIATVYVKTHRPQDPSVLDILTSIRGIPHVITVSQEGLLKKAPEGLQRLKIKLTFDDDHKYDIPDLEKAAIKIPGVKLFKVIEYEGKPYKDEKLTEGSFIRQFKAHARESDLVWHRDRQDRTITVLEGHGWQFQRDNELPQEMRPGQVIEVKANEWHRVIKGTKSSLKVRISEASNLIPSEMKKRPYRFDVFLDKMRDGTAFMSADGNEFTIPLEGNEELVSALSNKDHVAYSQAFRAGVVTGEGQIIHKSSLIKKTGDFGGIQSQARLQKENIQIDQINQALESIGTPVDIDLGKRIARQVVACESVKGTPKADAALIDESGAAVGYISLKYADTPKQMQQWGGVSNYKNHKEIKEFVANIKSIIQQSAGDRLNTAYYQIIKDEDLARSLVYGDGRTPENSVDIVLASAQTIELVQVGARYAFKAKNMFSYPNVPSGAWSPTLYATYRKARNDLGIPNTRVGCYTLDYRNNKLKTSDLR